MDASKLSLRLLLMLALCMQRTLSCGQQEAMTAVSWVTRVMTPSSSLAVYRHSMPTVSARLHVASSTCWLWLMEELYAPGVLQIWANLVRTHVHMHTMPCC